MNSIKLHIKTNNQKYPIVIGNGVVSKILKLLKENSINFNQCLLVVDNKVPKNMLKKILRLLPINQTTVHYFKANELNKNQRSVDKILNILAEKPDTSPVIPPPIDIRQSFLLKFFFKRIFKILSTLL